MPYHLIAMIKTMKNLMNLCVKKTLSRTGRKLMASMLMGSVALLGSTIAQAAAQTTIPVDLSGATATKYEIALLQVLMEVCPPMLDRQQNYNLQKTYNQQLKQMLPRINNPRAAIRYLSTQQDYKSVLSGMRSWTLSYSREENKALCTDLANSAL